MRRVATDRAPSVVIGSSQMRAALSMSSGEYWQPDIATAAEIEDLEQPLDGLDGVVFRAHGFLSAPRGAAPLVV